MATFTLGDMLEKLGFGRLPCYPQR